MVTTINSSAAATPANVDSNGSNDSTALLKGTKESLLALNAQRDALQIEAEAIVSELTSPGPTGQPPMGIDTPLVDAEGYPRNDIDLYRAKTLRGRLAVIRTDLAALQKDTERNLVQLGSLQKSRESVEADKNEYAARLQPKPKPKYDPVSGKWVVKNWDGSIAGLVGKDGEGRSFDTLAANTNTTTTAAADSSAAMSQPSGGNQNITAAAAMMTSTMTPFSRVREVAANSPAQEAGLLEEDLILRFGDISLGSRNNITDDDSDNNNDPMPRVAELVPRAASEGRSIEITVLRGSTSTTSNNNASSSSSNGGNVVSLTLTPRSWSGRGLIGCHIVPYRQAPLS